MTAPLPASGDTSWYDWAQDIDGLARQVANKAALSASEGIKVHDGTAGGGTRPAGYVRVRWVGGTTRPTNMAAGDVWEHSV